MGVLFRATVSCGSVSVGPGGMITTVSAVSTVSRSPMSTPPAVLVTVPISPSENPWAADRSGGRLGFEVRIDAGVPAVTAHPGRSGPATLHAQIA